MTGLDRWQVKKSAQHYVINSVWSPIRVDRSIWPPDDLAGPLSPCTCVQSCPTLCKGTWTQNIRQTVIGVGARRNPSPKREGLGFVFPSVMEAAEEQTQSSPFQMACNISYLPLCFPRMTVTSSLPGRGQAANNSVGTQKTVKGPHLVLSWLLIGHIQQELRKSSSKPTSDAVSGMWGQAHASASSSAEDENSKWTLVREISMWLGFWDGKEQKQPHGQINNWLEGCGGSSGIKEEMNLWVLGKGCTEADLRPLAMTRNQQMTRQIPFPLVLMLSCIQLFATPGTGTRQAPLSMGFSRQECWVCCHFLLQGIFPTQGSNPYL